MAAWPVIGGAGEQDWLLLNLLIRISRDEMSRNVSAKQRPPLQVDAGVKKMVDDHEDRIRKAAEEKAALESLVPDQEKGGAAPAPEQVALPAAEDVKPESDDDAPVETGPHRPALPSQQGGKGKKGQGRGGQRGSPKRKAKSSRTDVQKGWRLETRLDGGRRPRKRQPWEQGVAGGMYMRMCVAAALGVSSILSHLLVLPSC